jgi:hypothetical protein
MFFFTLCNVKQLSCFPESCPGVPPPLSHSLYLPIPSLNAAVFAKHLCCLPTPISARSYTPGCFMCLWWLANPYTMLPSLSMRVVL